MLSNFRTYQLAVELYRELKKSNELPYYLKDQLLRASSSTVLQSEGEDHDGELKLELDRLLIARLLDYRLLN